MLSLAFLQYSIKKKKLTPSVVPVITCKPSYVDLIYMPCGKI